MLIKQSNKGFRIENFSKKDWIAIGKKAGWIKKSRIETNIHKEMGRYGRDSDYGPSFETKEEALQWFQQRYQGYDNDGEVQISFHEIIDGKKFYVMYELVDNKPVLVVKDPM